MTKIIAIYARCSTLDQNVEMQLRDLRRYAEQRGFTIAKEYVDEGVSGAKDQRPALNELMMAARKREFDAVLVWRFDRFGRSLRHLVLALEEFQHLNVGFLSFQEVIDTLSPTGKVMFQILAAFAEFERNIIRERVRSGLANARASGKRLGRPRNKNRDDVRIRELRGQGKSLSEVAKAVGVSKGLVSRALSRMGDTGRKSSSKPH